MYKSSYNTQINITFCDVTEKISEISDVDVLEQFTLANKTAVGSVKDLACTLRTTLLSEFSAGDESLMNS